MAVSRMLSRIARHLCGSWDSCAYRFRLLLSGVAAVSCTLLLSNNLENVNYYACHDADEWWETEADIDEDEREREEADVRFIDNDWWRENEANIAESFSSSM